MERARLKAPLTRMQYAIVTLMGVNQDHKAIAAAMGITTHTVRDHARRASMKMPGDLPAQARCVAWVRGATEDVLEGKTLRYEMVLEAQATEPDTGTVLVSENATLDGIFAR